MYAVDDLDTVVEITDLPQSDVGAPMPVVLSDEHSTVVAYYSRQKPSIEQLGTTEFGLTVNVVSCGEVAEDVPVIAGVESGNAVSFETIALVRFRHVHSIMFGPPNDEAFHGHPLYSRGLGPYSAFEVRNSSWLRILERMNSVHSCHDPEAFMANLRHLVLAFHDSTFECIANRCESVVVSVKSERRREGRTTFVSIDMNALRDLMWKYLHAGAV